MKPYKTILLTSCGLHPQIITEVLYGLSQQNPPVKPAEIRVITTDVGMDKIKEHLLDPKDGFFHKLCKEYGLDDTKFELDNIQLLENAVGVPLEDIESVSDNETVANTITELVRDLTRDPDVALHVSLTGGRKTISYYLGYAISLFGRPQDRLSHTLVSSRFESDDEFFYPNKSPTYITDRYGLTLNTQDARVYLAEIPFVRLREGLPLSLLEGKATFLEAIDAVPKVTKTAQLEINFIDKTLILNDQPLKLSPVLFSWYTWLALRCKQLDESDADIQMRGDLHKEYLQHFATIYGNHHHIVIKVSEALKDGFSIDYISEKKTRINTAIKKALHLKGYTFLIQSIGSRPNTRYRLLLEPDNILIKQ